MPYLTETIAEHEQRCLDRMDAIIEHDDFAPMSGEELGMIDKETGRVYFGISSFLTKYLICLWNIGSASPLSASMVAFYTVMLQFVNNICLIGSLTVNRSAPYGSEVQSRVVECAESHCIHRIYIEPFIALQQDCGQCCNLVQGLCQPHHPSIRRERHDGRSGTQSLSFTATWAMRR